MMEADRTIIIDSSKITFPDATEQTTKVEEHGADKHTNVTRELFIPATEGFVSTGTLINLGMFSAVRCADTEHSQIYWTIKVPDDFVSFVSVKAVWLSTAAAGDMYWRIQADYAASGEAYTTHGDNPAFGATATGGNNIINVQEPANPLTLSELAIGDYLGLWFYRNAGFGLDTLDTAADLLGLLFTYVAEQ